MATEELPSDPYRFGHRCLKQALPAVLPSAFIPGSDDEPIPQHHTSLPGSTLPAEPIEQPSSNGVSYIGDGGVLHDSPWVQQIPTDHMLGGHSPYMHDISLPSQLPPSFEFPYSSSVPLPPAAATELETAPAITLPIYTQQSPGSVEAPMSSLREPILAQSSFHHNFTASPFSSTVSGEAGLRSPPIGDYTMACCPLGSPFESSCPLASEFDEDFSSEPYAKLIFRALMSAPHHRMVLREIYEWFERNTDKGKDPSSRGWQNSIRHNLSMNGAFRKEEQIASAEDGKRNCVWVLERTAIEAGEVQSTTRYRRPGSHKRVAKSGGAHHRQRSGAKGGRAAKGKHHRRHKGATSSQPLSDYLSDLAIDLESKVKSESEYVNISPSCLGGYTGIEDGLPLSPRISMLDGAAEGGPASLCSLPPAPALILNDSPTPTLATPRSLNDTKDHTLKHIVGCTDYDGTGFPFCGGLSEHPQHDFERPSFENWTPAEPGHVTPHHHPVFDGFRQYL